MVIVLLFGKELLGHPITGKGKNLLVSDSAQAQEQRTLRAGCLVVHQKTSENLAQSLKYQRPTLVLKKRRAAKVGAIRCLGADQFGQGCPSPRAEGNRQSLC